MRASAAVLTLMLVGLSGAALAAPDCHPPIDPTVPQYIVGYGSLMVASHQGLQSMGRVLTLGVTCCLFTSIIMLPALLTWLTRHRPEVDDEAPASKRRSLLESGVLDRQYRRQDGPHRSPPEPHSVRKGASSRL